MPTAIGPGTHVTIYYTLRDGRGNLLEETPPGEPETFVWGYRTVVPGLELGLEGALAGDVVDVTVAPEDGYGLRDDTDVFDVDRSEFPEDVKVGQEFDAEGDDGTTITMRVTEVRDDAVEVDANHPLAGETLNFKVRVVAVREATEDEELAARAELAAQQSPKGDAS
ncbi:MAG: peptidylprolyl isomerase [Polyangiales bacterium]